jgi:hypothetical protein
VDDKIFASPLFSFFGTWLSHVWSIKSHQTAYCVTAYGVLVLLDVGMTAGGVSVLLDVGVTAGGVSVLLDAGQAARSVKAPQTSTEQR